MNPTTAIITNLPAENRTEHIHDGVRTGVYLLLPRPRRQQRWQRRVVTWTSSNTMRWKS